MKDFNEVEKEEINPRGIVFCLQIYNYIINSTIKFSEIYFHQCLHVIMLPSMINKKKL